jgi:mRNA interferase MazF
MERRNRPGWTAWRRSCSASSSQENESTDTSNSGDELQTKAACVIRRGQVWWVDFGEPRGSEPGFRHPALVIQRNEVNASNIATVVVCVLTSNGALAKAPGNTLLSKRHTGLPRDWVANASQIATLNKDELEELAGTLSGPIMEKVDAGLKWFLYLNG